MNKIPHVDPDHDFWIFAYGSLMWNPGFPYVESQVGHIKGYHRSLCILSTIYRGTPDNPGLVLGLDFGGTCEGRAFRVAPSDIEATLAYLDQREQVTKVYCPANVDVTLNTGQRVCGYTFVVRQKHKQYVRLPVSKQAQLIAQGHGQRGAAFDYLASTLEQLKVLEIEDQALQDILHLAKEIKSKQDGF